MKAETTQPVSGGRKRWLLGMCILAMPVMLVFFLGSQMATSQVRNTYKAYDTIAEITRVQQFAALPEETVVMLRGRLLDLSCQPSVCKEPALLVYQERPQPGRELRFQEAFAQRFPPFVLELEDGHVTILPDESRRRILQHELHTVADGDRQRAGFRHGDVVTVQGQVSHTAVPTLREVTGISGRDKQQLMQEWQRAFRKVVWLRNLAGLLSGVGIVGLIVQLRRWRQAPQDVSSW